MNAQVSCTVNGAAVTFDVEPRTLLLDALRGELGLTGTHAGCEQGACGACTVIVDGAAVRSCLLFAVQVNGSELTTIEGVGRPGALHPVQQAISDHHGLQCGFCTPGVVLSAIAMLGELPNPSRSQIEAGMSGNLCRCTGYVGIVDAVASVSAGAGSTTEQHETEGSAS